MESLTHQVVKAIAYLLHLDTLERAMTELIIHTVSSQLGNLKILNLKIWLKSNKEFLFWVLQNKP